MALATGTFANREGCKMLKYYYVNRPGGIGCQPEGWEDIHSGLPKTIREADWGEVDSFGWVTYPEPLDFELIWKYDLVPHDEPEWARYMLWRAREHDAASSC
jgi:hypothetical protein